MLRLAMNTFYREEVLSAISILNLDGPGNTLGILTSLLAGQATPGNDPAVIAAAAQLLLNQLGLPPPLGFAQGFLTNRFFLQKHFQAALAFNTPKNTVIVRVFHLKRTPLDFDNAFLASAPVVSGGLGQSNVKQEGANLSWSHRITARTSLNAFFRYIHRNFPILARKDDIYMGRVSLSRELSENMFGFVSYRYHQRVSDDSSGDYSENRVTASLSWRFR